MERFEYSFNKIFVLKSLGEADTYADDLYYNTIEPCCKKEGIEMDKNADRIIWFAFFVFAPFSKFWGIMFGGFGYYSYFCKQKGVGEVMYLLRSLEAYLT